jgi:hypothetical protein
MWNGILKYPLQENFFRLREAMSARPMTAVFQRDIMLHLPRFARSGAAVPGSREGGEFSGQL